MIYASSKDTIKKSFTGLSLEFQANDDGDLDYKALSRSGKKSSLADIRTRHSSCLITTLPYGFCLSAVFLR